MRVLVCGSRTFDDEAMVNMVLDGIHAANEGLTVIHGAAHGADSLAHHWAKTAWPDKVAVAPFPADWEHCGPGCPPINDRQDHRKWRHDGTMYCPLAGLRRNQEMLDEGKPELVLAFVDKILTQSRGTLDMVTRAKKAGVPFYVIQRG